MASTSPSTRPAWYRGLERGTSMYLSGGGVLGSWGPGVPRARSRPTVTFQLEIHSLHSAYSPRSSTIYPLFLANNCCLSLSYVGFCHFEPSHPPNILPILGIFAPHLVTLVTDNSLSEAYPRIVWRLYPTPSNR